MGKARHGSTAGAGGGGGGPGELRQSVKVGKLNLVDLAGSERVHITGATGELHTSSSQPIRIHFAFLFGLSLLLKPFVASLMISDDL